MLRRLKNQYLHRHQITESPESPFLIAVLRSSVIIRTELRTKVWDSMIERFALKKGWSPEKREQRKRRTVTARPHRSFKYLRGKVQVGGAGAHAERINSPHFSFDNLSWPNPEGWDARKTKTEVLTSSSDFRIGFRWSWNQNRVVNLVFRMRA